MLAILQASSDASAWAPSLKFRISEIIISGFQ